MTLQAADNPISFFDIAAEFGYPTDNKLGNYRNTTSQAGWDLGNLPLDTGIPTSGPIKFSDFYSKQLNVVINCWDVSDTGTNYHVNARTEWENNNLAIVGDTNGTKKESGSKVIIHVNKEIGSVANNDYSDNKEAKRGKCALRTGPDAGQTAWNADVSMQIDLGDSARLRGAGGKGGKGNNPANDAGSIRHGREGNSALGIQFGTSTNKTIINVGDGAVLRAGFGGGGGGGGCYNHEGKGKGGHPYPGGGGGGGAGYPVGAAGARGDGKFGDGADAEPGTAGTKTAGGAGGDANSGARKGGDGGDAEGAAQAGANGSGSAGESDGGTAGGDGSVLRSYGASNTYTLNNSGSIVGGIKNNCDSAQIS